MKRITLLFCLLLAAAPGVGAQTPKPAEDPFERFLYPPELVMAHQAKIGLTDKQRGVIQQAVLAAQVKILTVQFKMNGAAEVLKQLLSTPSVDEAKVLEQVDEVLASEREVKRAQVALMVQIKNQLTEQQQSLLSKLRKQDGPAGEE